MKLSLSKINNMKISRIWVIFFIYSSSVSLAIQFIVLPLIFPSLNRGFGVMDGGDWVVYHYWSDFYAKYILENGWSYWSLRPQSFGLVGVTSAIYAFTGIFKPFVLIPLYSSLHAFGSLCIVLLMQKLGIKRSVAFFSALPYLIFPSSVMWVSQILKDVFTLNATLIMLYGVVSLFGVLNTNSISATIKSQLFSATLILISFLIVLVIRPYMLELNYIYLLLVLIGFSILLVYKLAKRKIKLGLVIISIFIQLSLIYLILMMSSVNEEAAPNMKATSYTGYIAEAEAANAINIIKLKELDKAGLLREGINRYWEINTDDKAKSSWSSVEAAQSSKNKSLLSKVDQFYAESISKEMMEEIQAEMIIEEKINALKNQLASEEYKTQSENKEKKKLIQAEIITLKKSFDLKNQIASEEYKEKSKYKKNIASKTLTQERIEDELTIFQDQISSGLVTQEMIDEIENSVLIKNNQADYDFITKDITRAEVDGNILPQVINQSDAKSIAHAQLNNINPYMQKDMAQLYEKYESLVWQETVFMPSYIDRKFKQIYDQRSYFYLFQSNANTTFDSDKDLNSSIKMLKYLPRAIQIGYLAPFPSTFFTDRSKEYRGFKSKIMKGVVHIEMVFIYISLLVLIFAIYLWRRKVEFWVMISFSLFFTVFPVYLYPNVGALVRYRYAGIMLITAICLCALVSIYLNYKNKKL